MSGSMLEHHHSSTQGQIEQMNTQLESSSENALPPQTRWAGSLIVSCINLLLIALVFVIGAIQSSCCQVERFATLMVIVPVLFFLSFFYIVADLLRRRTRMQALIAVLVCLPSGYWFLQFLKWRP